MEKISITIVVVDDDHTFASAIIKALKQSGFNAVHYTNPSELLAATRLQEFHGYLIDCLLPKMSGVDLAVKLKEQGLSEKIPIVLTSGILKDKSFIKETLYKTKADLFLEKPFDVRKLLEVFEQKLEGLIDLPLDPFDELLLKVNATPLERLAAIEKKNSVHGFQLPRIVSALLAPGISGILTLKAPSEDSESSIHFCNGTIVSVRIQDPFSFFGNLIIEKNLLTHEELENALAIPNPNKRVGERLVDANLISPHMIDQINTEQMAIRLSKLIEDISYESKFENAALEPVPAHINCNNIIPFYSDWIMAKISFQWLKTFFLPWMDHGFIKGNKSDLSNLVGLPPLNRIQNLEDKIFSGTLGSSLHKEKIQEDFLASVYFLLLANRIYFDSNQKVEDIKAHEDRLARIFKDLDGKNHFEILGVNPTSKISEIKRTYHDLAKIFHPDKLAANIPESAKQLTKDIFAKMTKSYSVLTNDHQRSIYLKEIEQGRAENILKSESLFEEAKVLLKSGQAKKAVSLFEAAMALRPPPAEMILYHLWAQILVIDTFPNPKKVLEEINLRLSKIPSEQRHNYVYYFVKGLFQRHIGEIELAKGNLKHALALLPNFVEARRELNVLELQEKNQSVDILHGDITQVVGNIFKKKR